MKAGNMKLFTYNDGYFDFVKEVKKVYEIEDLSEIHNQWVGAKKYHLLNKMKEDQSTVYHKQFYNNISNTNFYEVYDRFLRDMIRPLFEEEILYQKIPTFRVHQPNNFAVAEFHRDRDYFHSEHEINFFLPLTESRGTATIWAETEYGKADYLPMNADVGDFIMWDGANLNHGSEQNTTGKSRVSVDFRVLPKSKYQDNDMVSTSNKTKMTIGEYWECM